MSIIFWLSLTADDRTHLVDRLLKSVPHWLTGPVSVDVLGAIGEQLDEIVRRDLSAEFFVKSTSALIENWEIDYGLPTTTGAPIGMRRVWILARMAGEQLRNDQDFITFARSLIAPVPTDDPTPYVDFAKSVVYKPFDEGWVQTFHDVQTSLNDVGPAHVRLALAPWNEVSGLTPWQLDQMDPIALEVLTPLELDGPVP